MFLNRRPKPRYQNCIISYNCIVNASCQIKFKYTKQKGDLHSVALFPRLPLDGRPSTVGGSTALSAPEAAHRVSHPITRGSAGRSVPEYHTCPPPLCLRARGNKVSHAHNAMRLNPVKTQCRVAVSIWHFLKKTKSTRKVELCRWRLYVNAGGRQRGVKDAAR